MNVVIYDTNHLENLHLVVKSLGFQVTLAAQDIKSIYRHIGFTEHAEIYLLEVTKDLAALKMADKLIEKNSGDIVIFISDHIERVLYNPWHKIYAFSIIERSNMINELDITLLLGSKKISNQNLFIYRSKHNRISISLDGIIYIETVPGHHGKLQIIHETGLYQVRYTLRQIAALLGDNFIKCHKSYIVNRSKLLEIDYSKKEMVLTDGSRIPTNRTIRLD